MYVCVLHACSDHGGKKGVTDPLGMNLQMFVSGPSILNLDPLEGQPLLVTTRASV